MDAIPAEFCWKRGGDIGVIPYDCPSGYFRSLALCYEYCAAGYSFVAGVCWAQCSAGYKDHGMTCYQSLFDWYFKSSYIPRSITNFSILIPCPKGMYRSGALCYKNCQNLGMENCGIGACASTLEGCLSSIGTMAFDTISSIGSAIASVVTIGSTTSMKTAAVAAKNTIKNAATKIGKASMKKIGDNLKKILKNTNKKIFLEKARRSLL